MNNILSITMVLTCALILGACSDQSSNTSESAASVAPSNSAQPTADLLEQRLADLEAVKSAIERYKDKNGNYPIADDGWYGKGSEWGKDTSDWVPGLAPEFIPSLPIDPSGTKAIYLYRSNGADYKLIAHLVEDCDSLADDDRDMIDKVRVIDGKCWAYGYWTEGGAGF